MSESARARRPTLWPWGLAVTASLLAVAARFSRQLPGDNALLARLSGLPQSPLRALTLLGSWAGVAAMTLLLAWFLRDHLRPFVFIGLTGAVSLVEEGLKHLVHRPRPGGDGLGFPSGHAMATITLAMFICGVLWPIFSTRQRIWLTLIGVVFVLGVGISRVGLGAHWPTDVLGGWLFGAAYALWTLALVRRRPQPQPEGTH